VEPAFSAKEGKFCLAEENVYGSICGGIRSESPPKIEANEGGRLAAGERSSMPGTMAFRPDQAGRPLSGIGFVGSPG